MMTISYKELGSSRRGLVLWQIVCFALIWVVQQERNSKIFEDKAKNSGVLWDTIHFLTSFWACCTTTFKDIPLNVVKLEWVTVCSSKGVGQ